MLGIANGTTNYILDEMTTKGLDFDDVLKDAQAKGYAEADPTGDIEGYDAANKAAIIDPGGDAEGILQAVEQFGVEVEKIILTHGPLDHAGRVEDVGAGGAEREGPVLALDGALLKLAHEVRLGGKRAGDDHEAGRVAVEAVDDARTGHLAELGIAPQQAVEQRAAGVARARMHDETGGLVDDDDRIVLVDHVELHVLLGREGERLVKMGLLEQRDLVALGDLLAHLLDDLAVHLDASLLDELLQTSSGNIGHQGGENLVKAFSPEPLHRETW